ncbi:MAG: hypothetical protein AAF191_13560, partial [Verrucomicrobiota bacterium]
FLERIAIAVAILVLSVVGIGHHASLRGEHPDVTSAKQTARHLVQIYEAGLHAGVDFTGRSVEECVTKVIHGDTPQWGAFAGTYYGLPELDAHQVKKALRYLHWMRGHLAYADPHG